MMHYIIASSAQEPLATPATAKRLTCHLAPFVPLVNAYATLSGACSLRYMVHIMGVRHKADTCTT